MKPSSVHPATEWIYQGTWAVLVRFFRVPDQPPELPTWHGEPTDVFQPAPQFLQYLKFEFCILYGILNLSLLTLCVIAALASPLLGVVVLPVTAAFLVAINLVAYIALHLRYDTTWYVWNDRSLRIRRGIWVIHETTITFDNIQNVTVNQGPVQRWLGIADVVVQTAGGGGMAAAGQPGAGSAGGHHGLIEGSDRAAEIRDRILVRLGRTPGAGLGDDRSTAAISPAVPLTMQHLDELRHVCAVARRLS